MNGNINSNSLKLLQCNGTWGVKFWIRKFDEVQAIVDTEKPDIMFVTEANFVQIRS